VPAGDPFTHEFSTNQPPDELLRTLVVAHTEDFARCGYRIESHSTEAVILSRRYLPEAAYRVPVLVGLLFIILGAIANSPNALTLVGQIMLILAIALSIFVRATERVTISLSPAGSGTQALISGQATRRLRKRLLELAEQATNREPIRAAPSTT
jgi:hypothetical protein